MSLFETTYYFDVAAAGDGWAGFLCTDEGLVYCTLPHKAKKAAREALMTGLKVASETNLERSPEHCAPYAEVMAAYFRRDDAGALETLPIDWSDAPPFFHTVREACRTIPAGETRTYQWLATQAGSPRAVRAAGQAMAKNPTPLFVPCHRVLCSDGSLGGFGAGPEWKRRLLDLETPPQQSFL